MDGILTAIKESEMLDDNEYQLIEEFHSNCVEHVQNHGVDPTAHDYTVDKISNDMNLSLYELPKEGVFIQAIWVIYLTVMRNHLSITTDKLFKYQSLSDFHHAYNDIYLDVDVNEQEYLWHTANWMSILFSLIPARKNKGLAMQIIPKLVEGWHAKYVTGSGQTKATASRVHIFETEGEIQANHRGGRSRSKRIQSHRQRIHKTKKTNVTEEDISNDSAKPPNDIRITSKKSDESTGRQNPRKRKLSDTSGSPSSNENVPVSVYLHPINASKYRSHLAHLSSFQESNCDLSEATDADNDSVDEDDSNAGYEYLNNNKSWQWLQPKSENGTNQNERRRTDLLKNQAATVPILDSWMKPSNKFGDNSHSNNFTQSTMLVRGNSLDCSINGWTFDPYLDFDNSLLLDLLV